MTRICARIVGLLVLSVGISGVQAQSSSDSGFRRTSWESPDLQGVWHFNTNVPLESPRGAGEIAATERSSEPDWRLSDRPPEGDVGAYNTFWLDIAGDETQRRAQIIDPPDERIPALRDGAEVQFGSLSTDHRGSRPVRYRSGGIGTDGPEDRGVAGRCIIGLNSGPQMLPIGYNNNMQLF
jgi:hypothetical protein